MAFRAWHRLRHVDARNKSGHDGELGNLDRRIDMCPRLDEIALVDLE